MPDSFYEVADLAALIKLSVEVKRISINLIYLVEFVSKRSENLFKHW